ncbi:hypothetical protein WSM22_04550 [Cytophagales bacterium WSM2-2]|nr:hypothetical protein WSM22_04550 [Cytophagales bacterium WSM2-2]
MSHKKYRTETKCLNCGAEVTGRFCSNCGQENIEIHENFFHLAGHFISDYFHFDSKFFRSLTPLFIKPGFLTKEYWEGRRVRYIHPLRLFFFVTIIFVIASGTFYSHYDKELKAVFKADTVLTKFDDAYLAKLSDSAKLFMGKGQDSLTVAEVKKKKAGMMRQLGKLAKGTDDVFKNLKYVTFFLLPIYALLFKVLYIRRKTFYVDQLVFMMHVQSFIYSVLSLIFLLPLIMDLSLDMIRRISTLVILIYLIIALRYLYHQAWWKTILKSIIATVFLVMITFVSVILIAGLDAVFFQ